MSTYNLTLHVWDLDLKAQPQLTTNHSPHGKCQTVCLLVWLRVWESGPTDTVRMCKCIVLSVTFIMFYLQLCIISESTRPHNQVAILSLQSQLYANRHLKSQIRLQKNNTANWQFSKCIWVKHLRYSCTCIYHQMPKSLNSSSLVGSSKSSLTHSERLAVVCGFSSPVADAP